MRFASAEPPYLHLRPWMYWAPVPRTKLLSPYPAAIFDGVIHAGERSIELAGWIGMIGHNWGTQHAERWIWLHGTRFAEQPDAWFDGALGRIKLGSLTTPWIANGVLSLDGERHVLGGLARLRATKVRENPTGVSFTLPGKDITVRGEVEGEASNFIGWIYADPDGSQHNTVNCSIADMTLTLATPGRSDRVLRVASGAAYELGMRETDHGIPLAPFSDP